MIAAQSAAAAWAVGRCGSRWMRLADRRAMFAERAPRKQRWRRLRSGGPLRERTCALWHAARPNQDLRLKREPPYPAVHASVPAWVARHDSAKGLARLVAAFVPCGDNRGVRLEHRSRSR